MAGPEQGVAFPVVDGRRSTTATGTALLADAVRGVDPALAARITAERDWRSAYVRHVRDATVASVRTPEGSLAVAADGLASLHRRLVLARPDGEVPLAAALPPGGDGHGDAPGDPAGEPPLGSATVAGAAPRETELTVPYAGSRLRGAALLRQLERWEGAGVVEPSHAEAVRRVAEHPEWLDLSDRSVALLGAGAEMSPLPSLLRWGATVHAVDVASPPVWRRVLGLAASGAGRVVVPVRRPEHAGTDLAAAAGADLLTAAPAVRRWLADAPRPLVVGNYVYADGGTFLRLAAAVDAVSAALLRDRPDTALAILATPTDVFAVPPEVVAAARARYAGRGWRRALQAPVQGLTGRRAFRPSYRTTVAVPDGRELGIADCLVAAQGPNYALAKAVQRWRAVTAYAAGVTVSANVAPPTRTRSVLRNRALAAAYGGAHRFGVEVFAPATSSTLMAALLVHDLRTPPPALVHPQDLFASGANHGGLWRLPYEPRSVLGLAVLLGILARG